MRKFDADAFIDQEEADLAEALADPNFVPESVMTPEMRAEFGALKERATKSKVRKTMSVKVHAS